MRPAAEPEQRRAADRRPRARPTCPIASRPGARSTDWSGRTPTPSPLEPEQLAALRGWVAGGGRLVIVGGTAGTVEPDRLPGRPAALPPDGDHRCRAGVARAPARRGPGRRRRTCRPCAASSAGAAPWRRVGDRVVAAERPYGSGLGHDRRVRPDGDVDRATRSRPTACGGGSCRPARRAGPVIGDDSQIVQAASQLPSLALPPIGGPARPAGRLHPAHRADQLLRPQAPRPARVGVGDDAGPDRRLRGRRLRASARCCAAAT